jgi:hypothetical protein
MCDQWADRQAPAPQQSGNLPPPWRGSQNISQAILDKLLSQEVGLRFEPPTGAAFGDSWRQYDEIGLYDRRGASLGEEDVWTVTAKNEGLF